MTENFNVSPYFDDFDVDKGFHRILFKPSVAVQARELTQLQTILQKQIEHFGKHIFQTGTIVYGGAFDIEDSIDYVRVDSIDVSDIDEFIGREMIGSVTGLKAHVTHAMLDDDNFGTAVLFVRYKNSTNISSIFQENEVLENPYQNLTVLPSAATGKGSLFSISEGVCFVKGYFIKFDKQSVAIDKFSESPTKKIYFKHSFYVVDSNEDTTLLDNAQGFPNFSAPGADRLKAELTLVSAPIDQNLSDDNHHLLLEIVDGEVKERKQKTEYSKIYDEMAKRTHDESGDYVVRGFETYTREHLDTGSNGGRFTSAQGGDKNKLSVGIETGHAYVKGYEIETLLTRYIDVDKSTEFVDVNGQVSYVSSGNYTEINEITGLPDPDRAPVVNLYDTSEQRLTNGVRYDAAATGTIIGKARLNSVLYQSGLLGNQNAVVRLYVNNIEMNSGYSFAQVGSIGNASFFADTIKENGDTVLKDVAIEDKLHYVGKDHTRRLKDVDNVSDTTITSYRHITATIDTTGAFTSSALSTGESLPYGTTTLGSIAKRTMFLSINADTQISQAGTVDITAGSASVAGTTTYFTRLNVGDRVRIDNNNYFIQSIESDTAMTLKSNALTTFSGAYTKNYLKGDYIDLTSKGSGTGNVRKVTSTTDTLTFDLEEDFPVSTECKLVHQVVKSTANEIKKQLKPNRIVLFDFGAAGAPSADMIPLGFSDVYKIHQVRLHNSAFAAKTDGTDVTSDFELVTGQTRTSYDTSYLKTNLTLGAGDHLLVEFAYFKPDFSTGTGYFSVDSYPIDDSIESDTTIQTLEIPRFKTKSGEEYNLRNYIDTRPIKTSTAVDTSILGDATVNPTVSDTYNISSTGLRAPIPGTSITFDYSFYLARRDIVAVDHKGNFTTITGVPAVSPIYPALPEDYMAIANLYVPPYPSISSTLARMYNRVPEGAQTQKVTFARHTMRDIGVMKKRIKNLEYYNALNLLEKTTMDMLIHDENGLDRFKNGVFVETFTDHSLGDTVNPDYRIAVDKLEKSARPVFDMDVFDAKFKSGTNVKTIGNLVTMPYTEKTLIEQPFVTTYRNIEQSVFRFIGNLDVFPPVDTWIDETTVDKTVDIGMGLTSEMLMRTEWGSWQSKQTGAVTGKGKFEAYAKHNSDNSEGLANATYLGEFDTQAAALRALYYTGGRAKGLRGHSGWGREGAYRSTKGIIAIGGTLKSVTVNSRQGVETSVNVEDNLTELGSFVTDASLIPYIRPQTIRLYAKGLKANTRFYVYFDGEDMTDYVTPVEIQGTDLTDVSGMKNEGDPIRSDEFGDILCFLRLPTSGKQFRVGTKEIMITDSPTNAEDATSYAKDAFVASGLSLQKQNTILSTQKVVGEEKKAVSESHTTINRAIDDPQVIRKYGPSCMAYSFYVDVPDDVSGVFLTSVDVFIQAMHESLGVWFEIREMSSGGTITRNQVPFSEVWMKRNDPRINITPDASTPTNVNFEAPVFLYNKTQYAFVIHTEGLNPDTYFWVSRLGENDINTGNPVVGRQLTGTTFTTNNNLNWDMVPDVDLKVRFNRADFDTSVSTEAVFGNEDVEFIDTTSPIPDDFFNVGEPVKGSDTMIIAKTDASTGIVEVGDSIKGLSSGVTGKVIEIDGTNIKTDAHDYFVDESIEVYSSTGTLKDIVATISSIKFGLGLVGKIIRKEKRFIIDHSNGEFFVGCKLRSILPNRHVAIANAPAEPVTITMPTSTTSPNPYIMTDGKVKLPIGLPAGTTGSFPSHTIEAFGRFEYSAINVRPGFLNFASETDASFRFRGIVNGVAEQQRKIETNDNIEFNKLREIYSRSEEKSLLGGAKSYQVVTNLSTKNRYVAPIIDQDLMSAVCVINNLNDDTTGELLPNGGNLDSKYISKVITLAEGQDAEDLLLFTKEYRPSGCDIKAWARIRNKYDTQPLEEKDWIEMTPDKERVSYSESSGDFVEAEYYFDDTLKTGSFGEIQYQSNGNTFTGFIQFQIKIGFVGANKAVFPKASQLRAIALQV